MATFPLAVMRIQIVELYLRLPSASAAGVDGSKYLMGRDVVGVPMRRRIEDAVISATGPTTCVLDFAGVDDISASVAEELGPILLQGTLTRGRPDSERYLVYSNLSHDARLGLDDVFRRTGRVALSILADDQYGKPSEGSGAALRIDLLGPPVPKPLEDVVAHCYARGGITSSDIQDGSLAAASKKLTELYERYPGIVHRVKIYGASGARSWHYSYIPVIVPDTHMPDLAPDQRLDEVDIAVSQEQRLSYHA
jgi:hypothetical protein